jgi:MoaA/NifB/PqqE/SkfB family radical SAM enzyme
MDREPGNMELPVFKKLIDEIADYPFVALFIVGQGESSLNPDFPDMMRYASGKSIKIDLTTN